jgi:hypothetical protein
LNVVCVEKYDKVHIVGEARFAVENCR